MSDMVAILRLTSGVFVRAPKGELTAEDTGIPMWPVGAELVRDSKQRAELDAMGVRYEVLIETSRAEFDAALNTEVMKGADQC